MQDMALHPLCALHTTAAAAIILSLSLSLPLYVYTLPSLVPSLSFSLSLSSILPPPTLRSRVTAPSLFSQLCTLYINICSVPAVYYINQYIYIYIYFIIQSRHISQHSLWFNRLSCARNIILVSSL